MNKDSKIIYAYYNTYDKEFEPNTVNVVGTKENIDKLLEDQSCLELEKYCNKYENECIKCIANKYNLDIIYS